MHSDEIKIDEPCHEDWDSMSGDDRKRFCGSCQKHVHDLGQMTQTEFKTLRKVESTPCVQYATQSDGTVRFKMSRRRRLMAAAVGAAALVAGNVAHASGSGAESESKGMLQRLSEWLAPEPEPQMLGIMIAPEKPTKTTTTTSTVIPEATTIPEASVIPEVTSTPPVHTVTVTTPDDKPLVVRGKIRRVPLNGI